MYLYQYNQTAPTQQRLTNLPVGAVTTMGFVGAMLGGVVTAARDMRDVRAGNMTQGELARDVVKEAVGAGLATAVGTAAGGMVFRSGALSLVTMAVVGITTKYVYDGLVNAACDTKKPVEAPVKATAKRA